jgi:thiamine biosynthesis protein ThiS
MEFYINGEKRNVAKKMSIFELLHEFGLPKERIAIELNKEVIRKTEWHNVKIKEFDKIEIVHFVGGG